ncbi:MAG: ribosome hibernation-promoting factor, HPF/YfiA family [Streptosporangiaceae bacterium]
MEVIVKGRHITVPARFRQHAAAKLAKLEKLDQKAVRIDVEVSEERNPRQSDRRERVELTIRSRGPAIRAEAAADDRYTALDLAFAKLESRLRRAADRRKVKDNVSVRSPGVLAEAAPPDAPAGAWAPLAAPPARSPSGNGHGVARPRTGAADDGADFGRADFGRADFGRAEPESNLVPIQMEGDGPLILREKVHTARPMTIDQALLEMELVGHDFYLFHDRECDRFSVVYRRRGYDYGVIRLVEE